MARVGNGSQYTAITSTGPDSMASNKRAAMVDSHGLTSATWRAVNACPTSLRIRVCCGGSSKMSGELANTGLSRDRRSDEKASGSARAARTSVWSSRAHLVGPTRTGPFPRRAA
jgi:hypothetical protein